MKRIRTTAAAGILLAALLTAGAQAAPTMQINTVSASVGKNGMEVSAAFAVTSLDRQIKAPVLVLRICYQAESGEGWVVTRFHRPGTATYNFIAGLQSPADASKGKTSVDSATLRRSSISGRVELPARAKKVLAVRAELWHDGEMIVAKSPQGAIELQRAGLPEDWYVEGAHPDAFKYEKPVR